MYILNILHEGKLPITFPIGPGDVRAKRMATGECMHH